MASRGKAWFQLRWPALISAILALLAFPPFNLWPVIFVAFVPLFLRLRELDGRQAWKVGFFFGMVNFLGQMFWLDLLAAHWTGSQWLAIIPWVLSTAVIATFVAWICLLVRHCLVRGWLWMIPLAWAGIEVARSFVPVFAFPWGLAATPLYQLPILIQTAHFGTIYLVSAWVVLLNVIVVALIRPEWRKKAIPMGVAYAGLLLVSVIQYGQDAPSDPFPVTIGQPGVDLAFGNPETAADELQSNVDAITFRALKEGSKALILPEGIASDRDFPPKTAFHIDDRLPVVFGGQHGHGPIYQTAFSFDGKWHFADKTRLVIFGEFVPGRSAFPFIAKQFNLTTEDLDASKNGVQAVSLGNVKTGPMLCFEGLFPEISYQQALNGSKFISVMCIDDWYMGTSAPEQLLAASIFRAVETGLPVARAASLGYTAAVDPHGRILGRLPLKVSKGLRVTLPLPRSSPLFPLLPVFPVGALLLAIVLPWLPQKKPTMSASV